jgi:polysaccharide chain length determinant protein (PEP-CTERM system associated)
MNQLLEAILENIRGAWRFRWIALIVAWAVCILGWLFVLLMPNTYAASARVFVDTRTTLSQVTQGIAVEGNLESQIQRVRQAMLASPQLMRVAHETGLDGRATTPQQLQGVIAGLRNRIELTSNTQGAAGVYVISYKDTDRERAEKVVDRLLRGFVEDTVGGKKQGTEQAQRFLVDQIAEYERRLSAAEERLAGFKRQNVGLMPGAQGDYFQRLQTEMEALTKVKASLGIAERRREELQRQLHGEQPFLDSPAPQRAAIPGAPGVLGAGGAAAGAPNGLDTGARIRETQARLDELLLRFTDKHPDVIALRETLKQLQDRQAQEIEAARRGDIGARNQLGVSANPVFQSIQLALNQNDVDIAALRGEVGDREAKVANLKRLVDTAPETEAQLARLNRDYDVNRAHYQALVERLERARLGEEAENTGVFNFEVIDPPAADFEPVAPNRQALIILVLLAGLGAGGGLAYLLHQIRPVFTNARQIAGITGLPVLGSISTTWLEKHRGQRRRSLLAFSGAAATLVFSAMFVLVAQYRAVRLLQDLIS